VESTVCARARSCPSCAVEDVGHGYKLAAADEFRYVDPVDGSVSDKQGLRFIMSDGSRVVFRLSGTVSIRCDPCPLPHHRHPSVPRHPCWQGSVGATVRVYLERYEPDPTKLSLATADALSGLAGIALEISHIAEHTGRTAPTVIT